LPEDAGQPAYRAGHHGAGVLKGGEIVLADEDRRGRVHGRRFQGALPPHIPDIGPPPGQDVVPAGPEGIGIGLAPGRKPGVERRGNRRHGDDGDVRREQGAKGPLPGKPGPGGGHVHMGRLGQGVDAGIGAAGAVDPYRFAAQRPEGVFQTALDRPAKARRLELPTAEMGAVIGDGEAESGHKEKRMKVRGLGRRGM